MGAVRLLLALVAAMAVLRGGSPAVMRMPGSEKRGRAFLRPDPASSMPMNEVVKRLPSLQRHNIATRSAGGQPTNTTFELNDSNNRGLVHYSGGISDVIFVLTFLSNHGNPPYTNTHLYRSRDYGATFSRITSDQLDPSDNSIELYPFFHISTYNKNLLAIPHATLAKMYLTWDEGDNFVVKTFSPDTINPQSLLWHPTEDNWILAHDGTNDHLYVTLHYGDTWTKIADYVDSYQWGVRGIDLIATTVFFNTYDPHEENKGDQTVHLYTQHEPFTDETRRELDPNLGHHSGFAVVGPYIFTQKTDEVGVISLWVSYNREAFHKAHIPSTLLHQNYYVDHLDYIQAMVTVGHEQSVYNLYLSDITGVYYFLSLPDYFLGDLEVIEGINATIIANQRIRADTSDPNDNRVRTVMSYDNGGLWSIVIPPDTDALGNPVNCEFPCSLHFHMATSEYYRLGVYSEASSPGIIMAHGSLGTVLTNDPDLYISRDGGNSWHQTLQGPWGGKMLDHGGLIVVAEDYHTNILSNVLMYSCNEGLSWTDFVFSYKKMFVFGILTKPGETTTTLNLFGTDYSFEWTVVTVEFSAIFDHICRLEDYYNWEPGPVLLGVECSLGAHVVIERRQIDHCCLNGEFYVRTVNYSFCLCTEEDYDCDYGFMRTDKGTGLCVMDPSVQQELANPCANGEKTYMESQGYQKVPGDVCVGGVALLFEPVEKLCCKSDGGEPIPGTSTPPTTHPNTNAPPTKTPPTTHPNTNTPLPETVTSTPPTKAPPTDAPPTKATLTDALPTKTPPTTHPNTNTPSSATKGPVVKATCSNVVPVSLGVLLFISLMIIVSLVGFIMFFMIKYRILYRRYIRLAVEPQMEHFTLHNNSPERGGGGGGVGGGAMQQLSSMPIGSHDDDSEDDDKPIVP